MSAENNSKAISTASTLQELPDNDFGLVRERRDFGPLEVGLKPILPCPHRQMSFTAMTGWRYHPRAPFVDRLGLSRGYNDVPSTTMIIPPSWIDRKTEDEEQKKKALENAQKHIKDLEYRDKVKRLRQQQQTESDRRSMKQQASSKATVVSQESTETASSSAATMMKTESGGKTKANFLEIPITKKSKPNVDCAASTTTNTTATTANSSLFSTTSSETITPTVRNAVAKAELYSWYGKRPRKLQLGAPDYISWSNGSKTNELFSAVFVCPISKEVFLAARHGEGYTKDGSIVWYTKKSAAEHAAAARAMDCWHLREGNSTRIGMEIPYLPSEGPIFPSNQIPPKALEEIDEAKKKPCVLNRPPPMPDGTNKSSRNSTSNYKDPHEDYKRQRHNPPNKDHKRTSRWDNPSYAKTHNKRDNVGYQNQSVGYPQGYSYQQPPGLPPGLPGGPPGPPGARPGPGPPPNNPQTAARPPPPPPPPAGYPPAGTANPPEGGYYNQPPWGGSQGSTAGGYYDNRYQAPSGTADAQGYYQHQGYYNTGQAPPDPNATNNPQGAVNGYNNNYPNQPGGVWYDHQGKPQGGGPNYDSNKRNNNPFDYSGSYNLEW